MAQTGEVYNVTSGNMVLLVLSCSKDTAHCVVIWVNEDVTTAYRVGDTDRWSLKLVEKHWKLVS
jgi:hypothetical protein